MSALGERLREMTGGAERYDSPVDAMADAAELADEHDAATLALSAQGKGPHAAAVLRWVARLVDSSVLDNDGYPVEVGGDHFRRWAYEAES